MTHSSFNKEKYPNNKAEAHIATIMIICIAILLIDSVAIGWFTTQWYGSSSISPIVLPTSGYQFPSSQNFASCQYNSSTFSEIGTTIWKNNCDGVGEILYQLDFTGGKYASWLLLNNLVPDASGNVVNTYVINNSVQQPYIIPLRWTGSTDQLEIQVKSDGFHIPNYIIPQILNRPMQSIGDLAFFPYANPASVVNANIQTSFNNNQNTVAFTFNGNSYSSSNLKPDGNIWGLFGRYYAGVGSNTLGFVLQSVNTNNAIVVSGNTGFLNQIITFIASIFAMMVWGVPPSILPVELTLLAIRLPEIGLLVCIIILAASVI